MQTKKRKPRKFLSKQYGEILVRAYINKWSGTKKTIDKQLTEYR